MTSDSSQLRVAVLGLGMGDWHARRLLEEPTADLVAVVDLDPERQKKWAKEIGAESVFSDYQVMLPEAKPELVIIALPNFLHAPVSIDCLQAGCHVLCEKPMAMNVEEALRMRDAADQANRQLAIHLSTRFGQEAQILKELADDGVLGTPYHAYTGWLRRDGFPGFGGWFGQEKLSGGGPLIDLGVHRLDLAMWLMGSPKPLAVSGAAHKHLGLGRAQAEQKAFDVEDFATGFVHCEGGATISFEVSWAGYMEVHEKLFTRVMGTEGGLGQEQADRDSRAWYSFRRGGKSFSAPVHLNPWHKPRNSIAKMVDAVREGRPYEATAEDGIRVQQILDALYESAKTGREVEVKAG